MELKALLEKSGLTQAELAAKLKIRQPSVSKWNHSGIPLGRVTELARVTGIPREQIAPEHFGRGA